MAFRPPVQQTSYIVDSNGDPVYFIDGAIPVSIQSGGGTGGTASDFSATFPAVGTAAGALDTGGKMAPLELDASGNLNVNVQTGTLSVTVSPTESDTVTAAGPATIGASSVQLLAANGSRKRMTIQNVGTTTHTEALAIEVAKGSGGTWATDGVGEVTNGTAKSSSACAGSGTFVCGPSITTTGTNDACIANASVTNGLTTVPAAGNEFVYFPALFSNTTDGAAALLTTTAGAHRAIMTDGTSGDSYSGSTECFK